MSPGIFIDAKLHLNPDLMKYKNSLHDRFTVCTISLDTINSVSYITKKYKAPLQ